MNWSDSLWRAGHARTRESIRRELQRHAPKRAEIRGNGIAGLDRKGHEGRPGRHHFSRLERDAEAREFVGEPGKRQARVAEDVGALAGMLGAAGDTPLRRMGREVHAPPVGRHLRAEDEVMGTGIVGDDLRRPDLGRQLNPDYVASLRQQETPLIRRITIVVADGLSALAPSLHALPMLTRLREALPDWDIDPVLATQARVALADDIGELRLANISLIFIGERPGLKSPDSLGAYLTYAPRRGRTDAERNCVSNIRPAGLSYDEATFRLAHLIQSAYTLGASGTQLKDDSDSIPPMLESA